MPQRSFLNRTRPVSRPIAPSCRGGASSMLRLAQPGARSASGADWADWMQRAAAALAWPADDSGPSIITPLTPSRELAAH